MADIMLVDQRLKRKIETLTEYNNSCCSVKFKDLDETFFFDKKDELQKFLNTQTSERFYEEELRKGYFDYTNENNEKVRYFVKKLKYGNLEVIEEKFIV